MLRPFQKKIFGGGEAFQTLGSILHRAGSPDIRRADLQGAAMESVERGHFDYLFFVTDTNNVRLLTAVMRRMLLKAMNLPGLSTAGS